MLSFAEWFRTPVHSVPFAPAATCISNDQAEGSLLNSQCAISPQTSGTPTACRHGLMSTEANSPARA